LLTVLVRELPGLVPLCSQVMAVLRGEHFDVGVVEDESTAVSLLVQEPHAAVRADTCLPDHAGLGRDGDESPGRELVPVEAVSSLEPVLEQEHGAVGPPVLGEHGALEVDTEIVPLAGRKVPEPGPLVALPVVIEREALIARDRRPALRDDRRPLVEEFADRRPGAWVDHTKCGMEEIPVFSVFETEQRAVRREAPLEEAAHLHASDPERLRGDRKPSSRLVVDRDVDRESVAVADSQCDDPWCLGQALTPPMRDAFEEGLHLAPVEWLDEPASGLVAGLVFEPEDPLAVEGRRAVDQADRVIRHLAEGVRWNVPGMQLPRAGFVRRVDDGVRRLGRPLGKKRDRRAEALLPKRESHLVRG